MAKRVSPEEKPFNPVAEALTRSVLQPEFEETPPPAPPRSKVVNIDGKKQDGQPAKEPEALKTSTEPVNPKKLKHVRRFLVTDEENFTLDQLATDIGRRLGTTLDVS